MWMGLAIQLKVSKSARAYTTKWVPKYFPTNYQKISTDISTAYSPPVGWSIVVLEFDQRIRTNVCLEYRIRQFNPLHKSICWAVRVLRVA